MEPHGLLVLLSFLTLGLVAGMTLAAYGFQRAVFARLDHLIQGKRLSQALTLRLKEGIEFSLPGPNKAALKARIPSALEKWWQHVAADSSTKTSGMVTAVGINFFVDVKASWDIRSGLSRYLANDDQEGARRFLEVVVDQL